MTAVVDQTKCTACGECVSACPVDAITQLADKDEKAFIDPETCVDCGACVDTCPVAAIEM